MWCFVCLCICVPVICLVPTKVKRRNQIPWNWNYKQLWAVTWILGLEPRFSTGQLLATQPSLQLFSVTIFTLEYWDWCICSNLLALCLAPPTVWAGNTWRWEVCDETVERRVCAHACYTRTAEHAYAHTRRPEDFGGHPALPLSPCYLETGPLPELAARLVASKSQVFSNFCPQCWAVPDVM